METAWILRGSLPKVKTPPKFSPEKEVLKMFAHRKVFIGIISILVLAMVGGFANAASYLVYDGGGGQDVIQLAMNQLGTTYGITYDLRTPLNPVTLNDLQSQNYTAMVIGFNDYANMSGVKASDLASGITGNILLTGHDPDVHSTQIPVSGANPNTQASAQKFMIQALSYAAAGPGTGLVAFGDFTYPPFTYLPPGYGITATGGWTSETVTSFTNAGTASGVFTGLLPADMSNWRNSYHTEFVSWGAGFVPFELGTDQLGNAAAVTIGYSASAPAPVPEPCTFMLLGAGLFGLVGFRKKLKKQSSS